MCHSFLRKGSGYPERATKPPMLSFEIFTYPSGEASSLHRANFERWIDTQKAF